MEERAFLRAKILSLAARARRLGRLDYASVGIRPQDLPYAPSPAHFEAANERLAGIDREIARRLEALRRIWEEAPPLQRVLVGIALVEREIDRARRAWGLFFEVFSQRGSAVAPVLAAHDVIATDCYAAIHAAVPGLLRGPKLKPLTYMQHSFSPATWRGGVQLSRLLGEANPFPLIRIPWDRDNPWQAVFLHECAHNLQADLGIWQENRIAVVTRTLRASRDPALTQIYGRWHKEIFADLAALLLGGPAAAWGLAIFLAHPAPRALTYRAGGAHPTGYIRVLILAEMLRRMGFTDEGARLGRVWRRLYDPHRGRVSTRLPPRLISTAPALIRHVVDEIAFQTRRNLAQHALVDVIPFRQGDEERIRESAQRLAEGRPPVSGLPPRHLVSAASYALATGSVRPQLLSEDVVARLVARHPPAPPTLTAAQMALAA
jgi:hypothetical protein